MIRQIALLLAAVLLLGSCAAPAKVQTGIPNTAAGDDIGQKNPDDLFGGWPQPGTVRTVRTAAQRTYGSAALLGWPSALVSVYLNEENGAQWDDAMIARSRANLAVAVDWLEGQAAQYGAHTTLYYDDGSADSGLFYTETYAGKFVGEESSEGEMFFTAVDDLCAAFDTEELHRKYGTTSIGFLVFLPVNGCSFTMVHYLEDENSYYHEYSCLYAYDTYSAPGTFDGPAVYAHEILHLYGAPDLYEDSSDYYVTPALVDYVAQMWPDAIMYDTYETDGSIAYDRIDKSISPVTACRLGLREGFAGQAQFPGVMQLIPGTFCEQVLQMGDVRNTPPQPLVAA